MSGSISPRTTEKAATGFARYNLNSGECVKCHLYRLFICILFNYALSAHTHLLARLFTILVYSTVAYIQNRGFVCVCVCVSRSQKVCQEAAKMRCHRLLPTHILLQLLPFTAYRVLYIYIACCIGIHLARVFTILVYSTVYYSSVQDRGFVCVCVCVCPDTKGLSRAYTAAS